jgi:hypothetical protein
MYLKAGTLTEALVELSGMLGDIVTTMEAKANEVFPTPLPLETFPSISPSSFSVDNANLGSTYTWWIYKDAWGAEYPIENIEKLTARKNTLLESLVAWEEACNTIEEKNKQAIIHNTEIHKKVTAIMDHLGVKRSYSEVDRSSRARNPRSITKTAGYLTDITKVAPVSQWTGHKQEAQNIRNRIEESYRAAYSVVTEKINKQKKEKEKAEGEARVAFYKVKYGCDPLSDVEDILTEILGKCKYLKLAHYLQENRNDWSEGYGIAECGLGGFTVETEEDQEIEDCLRKIIERDDGEVDGRYFRDCEYGYDFLFEKVDSVLYNDYLIVKELKEKENG